MVIIGEAEECDVQKIYEIEQQCINDPWSEEMLRESMAGEWNHYIVAREEQNILGYASLAIGGELGDVLNIAVKPQYRREGIGEKLMKELETIARTQQCEKILLEVRESNNRARGLYEKLQYHEIALRKNYYMNPVEHGIIMEKLL